MTRVYVAGQMTGIDENNFPAFQKAAALLRAAGYDVVSPDEHAVEGEAYADAMRRDFGFIMECDAICLLTGWQQSRGAVAEKAVADALGLRIGNVDDFVAEPVQMIKWIGGADYAPRRGYDGDAGFDLIVSERTSIPHGEFRDVPLGISVEMPPGVWAMLTGRSSTLRKRGLLVTQGIIDNGYRGPLYAGAQNLNPDGQVVIEEGERIAQLIPYRLEAPLLEVHHVETLGETDRGERGFGSTGL